MRPGLRSYYLESRQISNARVKEELGVQLKYPTYREGYSALNTLRLEREAAARRNAAAAAEDDNAG